MVFVTGGSGLVGSHLILDLLRSGHKVRALYRPQSNLARVRQLYHWYGAESEELFENIEWVNGDLTDIPSLDIAMEGATEVYHCGALISFDPRDRSRLLKVNQEGTRNIVNLCLHKGVSRLYYTSSIATIGGTSGTVSEKDLWDPAHTNAYATSKYLAEMEVWRGGQEGLQTVLVNPGVILGPGFWSEGSGRIFSRLNSGLKIAPPGSTGFVGVWDVIRAINALASWQLELLWRMDWARSRIGGRKRRLSKSIARSLRLLVNYSSKKIEDRVAFRFQPLDEVLQECAENFREGSKMPQS